MRNNEGYLNTLKEIDENLKYKTVYYYYVCIYITKITGRVVCFEELYLQRTEKYGENITYIRERKLIMMKKNISK